jgi:hypothetical protein
MQNYGVLDGEGSAATHTSRPDLTTYRGRIWILQVLGTLTSIAYFSDTQPVVKAGTAVLVLPDIFLGCSKQEAFDRASLRLHELWKAGQADSQWLKLKCNV